MSERDPVTLTIAENIRYLMERQGLNPAELRRKAKINQTGVHDILSGRSRSPKVETVAKIASALGVTAGDLISPPGEIEERRAILAVFDKLPRAERDRLVRTGQAWLAEPSS